MPPAPRSRIFMEFFFAMRTGTAIPASRFRSQCPDHALGLAQVAGAEEVEVIQHVVEVVQRPSSLVALGQGPFRPVCRIEARRKAAEQLGHGEIRLPVAAIHGRVEDRRPTRYIYGRVAAPQVAMEQAGAGAIVQEE